MNLIIVITMDFEKEFEIDNFAIRGRKRNGAAALICMMHRAMGLV